MASGPYNKAKKEILSGTIDLAADTLVVILVDSTYTFDPDQDTLDDGTAGDVASHEIVATNYTAGFGGAGRKVLASKTFTQDNSGNYATFDAADPVWTSLGGATNATVGGAVIAKEVTDDAHSRPIFFVDFANIATTGSDFTVLFDAAGIYSY